MLRLPLEGQRSELAAKAAGLLRLRLLDRATVAVIERGASEEMAAVATIVNLFDTTNSASDDGCRDIRVALVDPTLAL